MGRRGACSRSSGAPTSTDSGRTPPARAVRARPGRVLVRVRRRVPLVARRRDLCLGAWRASTARATDRFGGVFIGDGPERPAVEAAARACPRVHVHRRPPAHDTARRARRGRHRRRAVRPGTPPAAAARLLLVAAQGLRVHGCGPAGGRAGAAPARAARRTRPRGLAVRPGRSAAASTARSPRWPIRRSARDLGAAARARVVRDFSWQAHCRALDARLRDARPPHEHAAHASSSSPTRFRPSAAAAAGARSSSARGLIARGHHVEVVKVDTGVPPGRPREQVRRLPRDRPSAATRRNVPSSATWSRTSACGPARPSTCTSSACATSNVDIVHAQHVMTTVPSIRAAHRAETPVGRDRPRLLAGVLLVGPHLRPVAAAPLSRNARSA